MRTTKQLSVTLPKDMAEDVAAKVASGAYASESEVIREGLRALRAQEKAVERWLQGEAADIYDRMKADPDRARSAANVKAALADARTSASKRK